MKTFKKVLASALAAAMVVTAFPVTNAEAASTAKLNKTKATVYAGQSTTLKVTTPKAWKSVKVTASKKGAAAKITKVSGKKVTVKAVKAGTAKVTVKVTAKKAGKKVSKTLKATVTVKNPSLSVKAAKEVAVGATEKITATVKPAGTKVTYTSNNKEVATVDAKGVVTGVKAGDVTITVKAGKTKKTVKMTVVAALSAKQTKTKEITVTSATPVTKDSKISVKRGSVEIALDEKIGVAIDATTGKTVVLTTAAKLTKGDYTVTIDDKTVDFQAEDEKVESIEFTSDKAVLQKPASGTTYTTAKVAYKVYNQFKEDVTSSTNGAITVNGNGATKTAAGEVTFTNANGYRLNDVVAAVVIYQANAQAVTKSGTFTISNEAAISEITIKDGVYNKKGEAITLDEDYDLSKGAYVLVSAKDQYGNDVTTLDWSAATTKNAIVQVAGGLTNLKAAATTSEEITVAGVKYAGIKLAKDNISNPIGAGNATLIVISNGTGKTAQGTVTVANGVKVDTITINVPSTIYGGEDNELTYSAKDTYGKDVTSVNALAAVTGIDSSKSTGAIWVKEDPLTGNAKMYYTAASNTTGVAAYDVKALLTKTYKASTVNFTIQPNAVPTAITGTKDLTTGAIVGGKIDVKLDNIKVVDQYGRAITPASPYVVTASVQNDSASTGLDGKTLSSAATQTTALVAGESKVKFTLYNNTTAVNDYTVTFTGVNADDIKTYEVADIATLYMGTTAGTAYDKTADVKGVTADGVKVAFSDYTVACDQGIIDTDNKKIKSTDLTSGLLKDKDSAEVTLVFTMANGTSIEKKVTLSKAAPQVKTVKLKNDKEAFELSATDANNASGLYAKLAGLIEAKDQYGVDIASTATPRVTVTDIKKATGSTIAVTSNGLSTASIKNAIAGDVATITLTFAGGTTFKAKLVVEA